ncbi:MAG: zinc ABC transporter substrate-binding protein [Deltaproteobacteria bacterium]|nr:zinc ABC transporter substrate-binding protein [Deltaproteobacteria bacterium]
MKRSMWVVGLAAVVVAGCSGSSGGSERRGLKAVSGEQPIGVVTTTGMIADAVEHVGGHFVRVKALMGPGVDPHLYKASEGDIARLSEADIIFYNGLNLEGKMGDVFVKMARGKPVIPVTDGMDRTLLREPPEFQGHYDPHVWFDVSMWSSILGEVANALGTLDPAHARDYTANAERYRTELLELHTWCRREIARIPKAQRVLITAHDAFGYFGRAYDIEVVGLQGISTVSEYGLKDVQRLVDVIVARGIKAVFVESSVPRRSIEAVVQGVLARDQMVAIGGQLFSDAMGTPGTPEGTYVGMVRANVTTIVTALLGSGGGT